MPRKKIIVEVKKIQRKCWGCKKRRTVVFTKTIVPTFKYEIDIIQLTKKAPKTKRVDLKGDRKCDVYHFCVDCAETQDTAVPEPDDDDEFIIK